MFPAFLKERIMSWQTTGFGVAVFAVWEVLAQQLSTECRAEIGVIATHTPALIALIVGALLKGPTKIKTDGTFDP